MKEYIKKKEKGFGKKYVKKNGECKMKMNWD